MLEHLYSLGNTEYDRVDALQQAIWVKVPVTGKLIWKLYIMIKMDHYIL